jgi:hypothetical protein
MTPWNIILLLFIIAGSIGIFFNTRSIIRKWKANPKKWFDLLVGILISLFALGILIVMFIRYLP